MSDIKYPKCQTKFRGPPDGQNIQNSPSKPPSDMSATNRAQGSSLYLHVTKYNKDFLTLLGGCTISFMESVVHLRPTLLR